MTGTDLLNGDTDTSPVSQRSESGQGILVATGGRGIVVVLSSHMSAGDYSLARHRDNVSYLSKINFRQRLGLVTKTNQTQRVGSVDT